MAMREQLLQMLRKLSLKRGAYRLASGVLSDHYVDVRKVALTGKGAHIIGHIICDLIVESFPGCGMVAGPTLGADPIVTATAMVAYQRGITIEAAIVRNRPKNHGTSKWVEGAATVDKSVPVLIIDDVVTSGGSLWQAAQQIKEVGYSPVASLCVVDREQGGSEYLRGQNLPLTSVFTSTEILGK